MSLREKLYIIIFQTDTKAGKRFDIWLLWAILISILLVMLESVPEYRLNYQNQFLYLEWFFTILFTIEFLTRIWISPKPLQYIFSFWGMIDFIAILPTFLSLFDIGVSYFITLRILRLMRVFRILKLAQFSSEAQILSKALRKSYYKISIFLYSLLTIVIIMGTIMYVIENDENAFSSIPQGIYWAIITITTVGYGDIVPTTVLGKFFSSFAMIIGYAIIAVPTGIVSSEMSNIIKYKKECRACNTRNESEANFCKKCGSQLDNSSSEDDITNIN